MVKHLIWILLTGLCISSCRLVQNYYRLNGSAMSPTIKEGSLLKFTEDISQLDYGDIIIYKTELDEYRADDGTITDLSGTMVLRIVGLPGDSIAIKEDMCIINGKKEQTHILIKSNYFNEYESILPNGVKIRTSSIAHLLEKEEQKDMETIWIPKDHFFVMGDDRSNAFDSRIIGTVPRSLIIAKVTEIIPPENPMIFNPL